jgi:hypothetical protein
MTNGQADLSIIVENSRVFILTHPLIETSREQSLVSMTQEARILPNLPNLPFPLFLQTSLCFPCGHLITGPSRLPWFTESGAGCQPSSTT